MLAEMNVAGIVATMALVSGFVNPTTRAGTLEADVVEPRRGVLDAGFDFDAARDFVGVGHAGELLRADEGADLNAGQAGSEIASISSTLRDVGIGVFRFESLRAGLLR